MLATDLLLGLLTNTKSTPQDQFPLKADGLQDGQTAFQTMFAKVLNRSVDKLDYYSLANNRNRNDSTDIPKRSAAGLRAEGSACATRDTGVKSSSQSYAEHVTAARAAPDQSQDVDVNQQSSSVVAHVPVENKQSFDQKLSALVDKIEREIDKGNGKSDEQMINLLMQLIALMLAGAQQNIAEARNGDSASPVLSILGGQDSSADGASSLKVALNLNPDSKIAKILDLLLNGKDELTAKDLENVDILLKLADGKGLLIPLSEVDLNGAGGEPGEGDANKITLQTANADGGKQIELTLTVNAESMKSAKLVDLSDPALNESDLVMIIPAENLAANGQAKAELQKLLDELAQQGVKNEDVSAGSKIVVPLKPAVKSGAQTVSDPASATAKPKIDTTDPMFMSSDKYLKALQAETLAKELSGNPVDRREIFDRLQRLLLADDSGAKLLSKDMDAKQASSFNFVKDWLQNFGEQNAKDNREWSMVTAKGEPAQQQTQTQSATVDVTPDRIPFIGRSGTPTSTAEIFTQRSADTARGPQSQSPAENVMQQIVDRAAYTFQNGTEGEIRIFLRPENLGDLQLKVKIEQDVVTAKFTAQSNEVKAIIENNLGQLKQALDQLGIKIGKFQVNVDTGSGQQPQQAPQDGMQDGSFGFGNGYAAGDAAESYGTSLNYDYETAFLYGSDGMVGSNAANINYLA